MLSVLKFGGTSLATPAHIRRAALHIKALQRAGRRLVVVASAMGHTTDHLIRLAKKTVKSPLARELDMLLTSGERVSMSLLAMVLEELGIKAISLTGSQSGILTDSHHGDAHIESIRPMRIQSALADDKVVIVAGFQGISPEKEITTLGRGGSDTTAVAIAAALHADECIVYTDVDGLFTANPRLIPGASLIGQLEYDEAIEMAHLGAKMHPRSLDLAKRFNVSLWIRSSMGDGLGTEIIGEKTMEKPEIRAITTQEGFTYWEVEAPLNQVAQVFKTLGSALRFFQSSQHSTSFLSRSDWDVNIKNSFAEVVKSQVPQVAIVSAVGHGIGSNHDLLVRFLSVLDFTEALLVTSNALSVSAAIRQRDLVTVAERLHRELAVH